MTPLLRLSAWIDSFSEATGKFIRWLVLGAVLISAGNALVRKLFNYSSNAFLEIQWYLFAGVFMLGVGYVFLHNAHVRIDFISARLSTRTNAIIDSVGMIVFTIPLAVIMVWLGWPLFHNAWVSGEMSQNAGGLIRWPVLALIPLGFAILLVQSMSELIKRIAYLTGHRAQPFTDVRTKSAEEELAEELAKAAAATNSNNQAGAR